MVTFSALIPNFEIPDGVDLTQKLPPAIYQEILKNSKIKVTGWGWKWRRKKLQARKRKQRAILRNGGKKITLLTVEFRNRVRQAKCRYQYDYILKATEIAKVFLFEHPEWEYELIDQVPRVVAEVNERMKTVFVWNNSERKLPHTFRPWQANMVKIRKAKKERNKKSS